MAIRSEPDWLELKIRSTGFTPTVALFLYGAVASSIAAVLAVIISSCLPERLAGALVTAVIVWPALKLTGRVVSIRQDSRINR